MGHNGPPRLAQPGSEPPILRRGVAVAAAVVIPTRRVRLTQGLSQIREPHATLLAAPLELASILRLEPVRMSPRQVNTTA